MSAARLAAAGLAFAACTMFGAVRRAENSERLRATERMLHDLAELRSLLHTDGLPLMSIAQRLSLSGAEPELWKRVAEGMEEGLSFSAAYEKAPKTELCPGAEETMERLASGLGSLDTDSELRRLTLAEEAMKRICASAREQSERKGKLTGSLSTLAGLAAALLIL